MTLQMVMEKYPFMSDFLGCEIFAKGNVAYFTIPEGSAITLAGSAAITGTDRFGNVNSALHFASSSDYTTATPTYNCKTIVVWAKFTTINTNGGIIMNTSSINGLYSSGATTLASGLTDPTLYVNGVESSTIATGSWMMLAVTSATNLSGTQVYLNIGSGINGNVGDIGEVLVFEDELSPREIKDIYLKMLTNPNFAPLAEGSL